MTKEIILREAQKSLICRGCSKSVAKGEKVVYTYSAANRGMSIFFCIGCAKLIGGLVKNEEEK